MPKRRKPWLGAQNVGRESMTLEEIIQNMQFKGLLDSDQFQIYDSSMSESENMVRNDAQPIVLMKPVHADVCAAASDLFSHKFIAREGDLEFDKRLSTLKTKEESTSGILEHFDEGMSRSYLKITETDVAKSDRKALQKSADNKVKLTNSASPGLQKDVIDKKVDRVQKSMSRKKSEEKENVKCTGLLKHCEQQPKSVSRSHEHPRPPAMKTRKSKTGPSMANKNLTSKKNSTKSKSMNKALATNVQSIVHEDDDTHTDPRNEAVSNVKDTTPASELLAEEEAK